MNNDNDDITTTPLSRAMANTITWTDGHTDISTEMTNTMTTVLASASASNIVGRHGGDHHIAPRRMVARVVSRAFSSLSLSLSLSLLVLPLLPQLAQAQSTPTPPALIVPSSSSVTTPTVDVAPNGVPLIQITRPNAGGLSHNRYTQFDVAPQGVILNNATTISPSQLGGMVVGNPHFHNHSANVILNEVTGSNRSHLNGYLEVAGQRADVIIANPNGISLNGTGFINANRGIFTTGVPQFTADGHLSGFRITQGHVAVEGAGVNDSSTAQIDILARSARINAALWANKATVITGSNQISLSDHDAHALQRITPDGKDGADAHRPTVSLDVSELGGMYAGQIRLIGTETGVGVNLAGTIAAGMASSAGEFTLDQAGRITLTKTAKVQSTHDGRMYSGTGIDNAGSITAGRQLSVSTPDTLTNRGIINGSSTQITADARISNTGGIYGDHLTMGTPELTNTGTANTNTGTATSPSGIIAARDSMIIGAATISNTEGGQLLSQGSFTTARSLDADGQLQRNTDGTLLAGDVIHNSSARISAEGDMTLGARHIRNQNAHLTTEQRPLSTERIDEYQLDGFAERYAAKDVQFTTCAPDNARCLRTPDGNEKQFYTRYLYDRTVSETVITDSQPGEILVGGNFHGIGVGTADAPSGTDLSNEDSRIVIGGKYDGLAKAVINSATQGQRITSDVGTAQHFYTEWHGGFSRKRKPRSSPAVAYTPTPVSKTISLALPPSAVGTPVPLPLPDSRLYHLASRPELGYVLETDPRLTNQHHFLSSDYLLTRLALDPQRTQKRLGDGYYEQQRVLEQILQLTGQRYLAKHSKGNNAHANPQAYAQITTRSAEQLQTLMDAGVEAAGYLGLKVGAALTPEQQQQLNADIVWLVEQEMPLGMAAHQGNASNTSNTTTTTKGTSTKTLRVLAPVVYLCPQTTAQVAASNLTTYGGLLSAQEIDLTVTGTVNNSGTLHGTQGVQVNATTITNSGTISSTKGRQPSEQHHEQPHATAPTLPIPTRSARPIHLTRGGVADASPSSSVAVPTPLPLGSVVLQAKQDIHNTGGRLRADHVELTAGRDLIVASTMTRGAAGSTPNSATSGTSSQHILLDQIAQIDAGTLRTHSGKDTRITAAAIHTDGNAAITAQRDIVLDTTTSEHDQHIAFDARNHLAASRSTQNGSRLTSGGAITLGAGRDVSARAATVHADGELTVNATRDIGITTGEQRTSYVQEQERERRHFLSSERSHSREQRESSDAIGSQFHGNSTTMAAGRDVTVHGSAITASKDLAVTAVGNATVTAATNTTASSSAHEQQKSGLLHTGGLSLRIGKERSSTQQSTQTTSQGQSGSTLAAEHGRVSIIAGKGATVNGSTVYSGQGNSLIQGSKVLIDMGADTSAVQMHQVQQFDGTTLSLGGSALGAVQTLRDVAGVVQRTANKNTNPNTTNATNTSSTRQTALSAANTAGALKDVASTVKNIISEGATAGVSLMTGQQQSEQTQTYRSSATRGSGIYSSGNTYLHATGDGTDNTADGNGSITVKGSDITSGERTILRAKNDIQLLASQDHEERHSTRSAHNYGIGLAAGISTKGIALGGRAEAGGAQGTQDGRGTTQRLTHIRSGKGMDILSGGDTTLEGAVVQAPQLTGEINGNLTLRSVQDNARFDSKDTQASAAITAGHGVSVDGGINHSTVTNDYASVMEQTGLYTGDGGFQLKVKGATTLDGAVIASTQAAIDNKRNTLETATLRSNTMNNHRTSEGMSAGLSGATPSHVAMGDNAASTTQSGISAGSITITDAVAQLRDTGSKAEQTVATLNRDVLTGKDNSGKIENTFDAQAMQAAMQATREFSERAASAIGDYASAKLNEAQQLEQQANLATTPSQRAALLEQARDIRDNWSEDGKARVFAHTVIGSVSGGLQGGMGAGAAAMATPMLASKIAELPIPDALKDTLTQAAGTAIGAITGGETGASAASNEVAHNYLKHQEILALMTAKGACSQGDATACREVKKLTLLDEYRNAQLAVCGDKSDANCTQLRDDVRHAYADVLRQVSLKPDSPLLSSSTYRKEHLNTGNEAYKTISKLDQLDGAIDGIATETLEGIADLVKGGIIVVNATTGDPQAQTQLTNAKDHVVQLASSPKLWSDIILTATDDYRNKLADAIEQGDGNALGRLASEVVSSIVGPGKVKKVGPVANAAEDILSLLDEKATVHILDGDNFKSGGHRYGTGSLGKSEFPRSWSDKKISNTISDIATDPFVIWSKPDVRGYVTTTTTRDEIYIRVVYDTKKNRIVTGYPINLLKNPK